MLTFQLIEGGYEIYENGLLYIRQPYKRGVQEGVTMDPVEAAADAVGHMAEIEADRLAPLPLHLL